MFKYKPDPPGALKIAIQDTIATIAGLFGIIIVITLVVIFFQTPASEQRNGFWEVQALFAGIAILCFVALAVRVNMRSRSIYAVWERGVMQTARILSVENVGYGRYQRRILRYAYSYNGQTYEQGTDVNRRWTPDGEELSILVDPQKPDESIPLFKYV